MGPQPGQTLDKPQLCAPLLGVTPDLRNQVIAESDMSGLSRLFKKGHIQT